MTGLPRLLLAGLLPGLGLLAAALLFAVGQLPQLPPPKPTALAPPILEAERGRRPIDTGKLGKGDSELPAIRLLDHLRTATRKHPDLVVAYRSLARARGGPGHWRHYVDPWSKLPTALQPLRMQMNFASYDVRGYRRPADKTKRVRRKLQFGRDRRMNKTPGVNEMRLSLFSPPPASFTFPVALPKGAILTFGAGVPLNGPPGPVDFIVEVAIGKGPAKEVARHTVKPWQRHEWLDQRVDLSALGDREVQLTLRTAGPRGAFAFWSNPVIWKPRSKRPGKNIVFILIDTLRADAVKSFGGTHPITPNIDALAERGVSFTNCFAAASWTRSSMLAMFTGEHVTQFDPRFNTMFWMSEELRGRMYAQWPRLLTLHLRKNGYWVEAIGNNFFLSGYTPIGFDRGYDQVTDIRAELYDTPAITRGAVHFLEQNRHRPFFLYLHYDGPHSPYSIPKRYKVKGARPPDSPGDKTFEDYLGETRWTDEQLAPLFAALRRLQLDKNTLVVLTGDHGEVFHPAHDFIYGEKNRTLHHHGWSAYQEVLHVPLIISGKDLVPAGKRIAAPISQLDLAPTLLELAGVSAMSGGLGQSLATSILTDQPVTERPIVSIARYIYAIRRGRWKYIYRLPTTRSFRLTRRKDRKVRRSEELYDLTTDPHETLNLARKRPDLARELRQQLLSIVEQRGGQVASTPKDIFARQGLRLSLRLWGGVGPHRLHGSLSCDGTVVVRSLRGPTSHAANVGKGKVGVLLRNAGGREAEVELEFVGCQPRSIQLALELDGKALAPHQVAVGPIGLRLMPDTSRLPIGRLAGMISDRPPPLLHSAHPMVHLWLGSSYGGRLSLLGGGGGQAARLANQMLQDAGYSKGPGARAAPPAPVAPKPSPGPPTPPAP